MRKAWRILVKNPKERDELGDQRVERRMLLNCVFDKEYVRVWAIFLCVRIGCSTKHI
jgi:hypothetical protein